jgi:hypothetical protein
LYGSGIIRAAAILWLALAVVAGEASAQAFRVVVVPRLQLHDLEHLSSRGAVGLLVPGAGPRTSEQAAQAALERGKLRNWLRGAIPPGRRLIDVETSARPPRRGRAIVLALPRGGEQANDRRYPIAVLGGGYGGLLRSDSTRIPGLVTVADVAPTALTRRNRLESRPQSDPVTELERLDRRIRSNNRWRTAVSLLAQALVLGLALVRPRAAVLAFGTLLAANLALGVTAPQSPAIVLGGLALSVVLLAPLLAHLAHSATAVGLFLAGVICAYLVAFLVDGTWVALSPLGPTQNGRFYGISNLLETLLLVPTLVAAAALWFRHAALFAGVAAVAFVLVAGARFGADGGGAVVLGVSLAVLAAALSGAGPRTFALAGAGAVALVAVLLALDALTGPSSHVTRVLSGGPDDVASALVDRVTLSYQRATEHWYTALVVVAGILALAVLAARLLRLPASPRARALPGAFAAAIATSLVVNDSPVDVVLTGLVGYVTLEAYALARPGTAGLLRRRLAPVAQ